MKKLRSLLIDDEKKVLEVLRIKLQKHCPQIEILGTANDLDPAEQLIRQAKPELIFLDISMPGGTGFDLLKRFQKVDFQVIFCTGYSEYAIQAFKLSAVDYLLKPLKTQELINAVSKAIVRQESKQQSILYENLINNIVAGKDQSKKIAIPSQNEYEFVEISQIVHCEGWEKYTKIHLNDGRTLVSSYNVGRFRENLQEYGFYSCHKSHLINKSHIKKYSTEGILVLSTGKSVPVSRRKRDEFMELFIRENNA